LTGKEEIFYGWRATFSRFAAFGGKSLIRWAYELGVFRMILPVLLKSLAPQSFWGKKSYSWIVMFWTALS
jgi:hypothetical protein